MATQQDLPASFSRVAELEDKLSRTSAVEDAVSLIDTLLQCGKEFGTAHRYKEAEAVLERVEALTADTTSLHGFVKDERRKAYRTRAFVQLGHLAWNQRHLDVAYNDFRQAVEYASSSLKKAEIELNITSLLNQQERKEAVAHARSALHYLEEDDVTEYPTGMRAMVYQNLAIALQGVDRPSSNDAFQKAIDICESEFGRSHHITQQMVKMHNKFLREGVAVHSSNVFLPQLGLDGGSEKTSAVQSKTARMKKGGSFTEATTGSQQASASNVAAVRGSRGGSAASSTNTTASQPLPPLPQQPSSGAPPRRNLTSQSSTKEAAKMPPQHQSKMSNEAAIHKIADAQPPIPVARQYQPRPPSATIEERRAEELVHYFHGRLATLLATEDDFEKDYAAARVIQCMARGRTARKKLQEAADGRRREMTIVVPRENHAARVVVRFCKLLVKGKRERSAKEFDAQKVRYRQRLCAVKIQKVARRWLAMRELNYRKWVNRERSGAIRNLQCWFRAVLSAVHLKRRANLKSQFATKQKEKDRREYAAIKIQSIIRRRTACLRVAHELGDLRRARELSRRGLCNHSQTKIASLWRRFVVRAKYGAMLRQHQQNVRLQHKKQLRCYATVTIQSWARGVRDRCNVLTMQKIRRRREHDAADARINEAARVIQRMGMRFLARRRRREGVRRRNDRLEASKRNYAATKIQTRMRIVFSKLAVQRIRQARIDHLNTIRERNELAAKKIKGFVKDPPKVKEPTRPVYPLQTSNLPVMQEYNPDLVSPRSMSSPPASPGEKMRAAWREVRQALINEETKARKQEFQSEKQARVDLTHKAYRSKDAAIRAEEARIEKERLEWEAGAEQRKAEEEVAEARRREEAERERQEKLTTILQQKQEVEQEMAALRASMLEEERLYQQRQADVRANQPNPPPRRIPKPLSSDAQLQVMAELTVEKEAREQRKQELEAAGVVPEPTEDEVAVQRAEERKREVEAAKAEKLRLEQLKQERHHWIEEEETRRQQVQQIRDELADEEQLLERYMEEEQAIQAERERLLVEMRGDQRRCRAAARIQAFFRLPAAKRAVCILHQQLQECHETRCEAEQFDATVDLEVPDAPADEVVEQPSTVVPRIDADVENEEGSPVATHIKNKETISALRQEVAELQVEQDWAERNAGGPGPIGAEGLDFSALEDCEAAINIPLRQAQMPVIQAFARFLGSQRIASHRAVNLLETSKAKRSDSACTIQRMCRSRFAKDARSAAARRVGEALEIRMAEEDADFKVSLLQRAGRAYIRRHLTWARWLRRRERERVVSQLVHCTQVFMRARASRALSSSLASSHLARKNSAAATIQGLARVHNACLRVRRLSALTEERRHQESLAERQLCAVVDIQRVCRGKLGRARFSKHAGARIALAIKLQKLGRSFLARRVRDRLRKEKEEKWAERRKEAEAEKLDVTP